MDRPPPLPAKPAFYRSASSAQGFGLDKFDDEFEHGRTGSVHRRNRSRYSSYDDPFLDQPEGQGDQGVYGVRPLSSGSGFGRPLPPPPVPPQDWYQDDYGRIYDGPVDCISDTNSVHSSLNRPEPYEFRPSRQALAASHIPRPLPAAPVSMPEIPRSPSEESFYDCDYATEVVQHRHEGAFAGPDHRNRSQHGRSWDQGSMNSHVDFPSSPAEPYARPQSIYHEYDERDERLSEYGQYDEQPSAYRQNERRSSLSRSRRQQSAASRRLSSASYDSNVGFDNYCASDATRSVSRQVNELSIRSSGSILGGSPSNLGADEFYRDLYRDDNAHSRQQSSISPETAGVSRPRSGADLHRKYRSTSTVSSVPQFNAYGPARQQNVTDKLLNLEEFVGGHDPNSFSVRSFRRRGSTQDIGATSIAASNSYRDVNESSTGSRSPSKSNRQFGLRATQTLSIERPEVVEQHCAPTRYYSPAMPQSGTASVISATLPLSLKAGHARRPSRTMTTLAATCREVSRLPIPHSLTATSLDLKSLLPIIPQSLNKLSSGDYERCPQVSSRYHVFHWLKQMGVVTESEFLESLVGLFSHTVPTISSLSLQKIATSLLQSYQSAGEVTYGSSDQQLITFSREVGQGILPILSGFGCYSQRCHSEDYMTESRCYSCRCSRTIPKRYERKEPALSTDAHDWAQYWNLRNDEEPLLSLDKREVQRQYQIHEVVYSEQDYLRDLHTLQDLYHRSLLDIQYHDTEFVALLFSQIPMLVELSAQHLEPALRQRQDTQGPIVQNIGDIFLNWISIARMPYIEYSAQLRYADRAVRAQRIKSAVLRSWLALCESDPRSKKLDFSSFQGAPTRRMQRYALLLGDVLKRTPNTHPDFEPLQSAIFEIRAVCQECDEQVKIAHEKIALMDLSETLLWKVPQKDLALLQSGRQIHYRGDLQRKSESLTSWQTRDVVLLDNYLLCLKSVKEGFSKVISRPPIPVDYLVVDEAESILYKSTSSKLIGGTITHAVSPFERRPTSSTNYTVSSVNDAPVSPNKGASENLYPFTVRHAGKPEEKMTFYAESASIRSTWLAAVQSAKAARWAKVASREPFGVHILADQAFAAPSHTVQLPKPETECVSVVDAAAAIFDGPSINHVCNFRVQCASLFQKRDGVEVLMIGTDDGVYTNYHDHQWTRILPLQRVTQLAVLEEFGVLTVLADKVLIAYTLDDLLLGSESRDRFIRRPPQKLSGNKDVGFFEVGIMKSRTLVIYKKKDNGNSVFKCLEPVIGKKQEKKSFFKKGTGTEFFRDFDVSAANYLLMFDY